MVCANSISALISQICKNCGYRNGDYEKFYLLGYETVYSIESQLTFRRNMPLPTLGSKNKPSNKPTWKSLCLRSVSTLVSSPDYYSTWGWKQYHPLERHFREWIICMWRRQKQNRNMYLLLEIFLDVVNTQRSTYRNRFWCVLNEYEYKS
jgi:hypothetical protein